MWTINVIICRINFIGEIDTAIMTLDRAKAIAVDFSNPDIAPVLESEFNELYGKVRDWQAFQRSGGDSFGDWCIEKAVTTTAQRYYYER